MRIPVRGWWFLVWLPLVGCIHSTGVEPRRFVMDKAMKNEVERRELFEATLQVLDEHPEYVDQLFRLMLEHRTALNRFLAINASGLDDPQYAALMARHLTRYPKSLTEVLIQNLEVAGDKPEAQRAMALAMERRAALTAQAVVSRPSNVNTATQALIEAVLDKPEARQAFLQALRERREQIATLLLADPQTLTAVMGAMAERGVEDSTLARQLRSLVDGLKSGRGGSGPNQGEDNDKP